MISAAEARAKRDAAQETQRVKNLERLEANKKANEESLRSAFAVRLPRLMTQISDKIETASDKGGCVVSWDMTYDRYEDPFLADKITEQLRASGYRVDGKRLNETYNMGDSEAPCMVTEHTLRLTISWTKS